MGLNTIAEQPKRVYLSIAEGKIAHSKDGKKMYFASVEGELERIYKRERDFNGETVLYWYVDLRDGNTLYSISLPYRSGTFASIVLSLASDEAIALSTIKIEPYQRNGFTKVIVYSNGSKLDWVTKDIPAIEERRAGAETYKDYSKRMEFIEQLVAKVNRAAGAEK